MSADGASERRMASCSFSISADTPMGSAARADGADRAKVEEAAAAAKAGCPISKVLNLEIALELTVA